MEMSLLLKYAICEGISSFLESLETCDQPIQNRVKSLLVRYCRGDSLVLPVSEHMDIVRISRDLKLLAMLIQIESRTQ
jgi:hypothetical protein